MGGKLCIKVTSLLLWSNKTLQTLLHLTRCLCRKNFSGSFYCLFLSLLVQVRFPAGYSPEPGTNAGSRIEVRTRRQVAKVPPLFLWHCPPSSNAGTQQRRDADFKWKSGHRLHHCWPSHRCAYLLHRQVSEEHSCRPSWEQQTLRCKWLQLLSFWLHLCKRGRHLSCCSWSDYIFCNQVPKCTMRGNHQVILYMHGDPSGSLSLGTIHTFSI